MSHQRVAILGSRDLAQLIAHYIVHDTQHTFVGFFDDSREVGGTILHGPILGKFDDVNAFFKDNRFDALLCGVGYRSMKSRRLVFDTYSGHIPFAKFVHSTATVDCTASLGSGAFVLPGCIVDRNCSIGANVFMNPGCVISHDTKVGDSSFLGPRVTLAGSVRIGRSCFLGVSTTVSDHVSIADEVQTGAGTVVVRHLQEPGLYVGVPGRLLRRLNDIT